MKKKSGKTIKSVNEDIVKDIASMFINCLEKGEIPWRKPWNSSKSGYISGQTGKHYGLINSLILQMNGHDLGEFVTLNQVCTRLKCEKSEAWGHFIKDADGNFPKSTRIYYRSMVVYTRKDENGKPMLDEQGNEIKGKYFLLKSSNVWRIGTQVNLEPQYVKPVEPNKVNQNFEADKVFMDFSAREKLEIRHTNGSRAFYSVGMDYVNVPPMENFPDTADYYQVWGHECVHATGAESRLNRFTKTSVPTETKQEYSFEELVAEIGSNILLHDNGWDNSKIDERSQAYIQNWIAYLKREPQTIEKACTFAVKAVERIYGKKPNENE